MIESSLANTVSLVAWPPWPILRVARQGVLALGIKLAAACMAMVLQMSLARLLGPAGYGEYAYVIAWLQLLLLFAQSGLSMAAVRYMAEYLAQDQPELAQGFIRRSTQAAFISSIVLGLLMVGIAATAHSAGSVISRHFLLAGMALPVLAQFVLNSAVIRGIGQALLGIISLMFYPLLFLVALLVANLLFPEHLTTTDALALNLGAAVCSLGATVALRRRLTDGLEKSILPAFRTGQWLATATEMMFVSGLIFVQGRTGVIFSGWFLDADATGTYAVLERMADAALLGMVSVELLVAPKFSSLHTQQKHHDLERYARLAAWGSTSVTLVFATMLMFFGKPILSMFGSEFVSGYAALLVMLLGVASKALCGSVGLLLCMTGHQRDSIVVAAASLLLNIMLSLALIPHFGILGTAIAFACSIATWNLAMLLIVRWRLGFWGCIGNVKFAPASFECR